MLIGKNNGKIELDRTLSARRLDGMILVLVVVGRNLRSAVESD